MNNQIELKSNGDFITLKVKDNEVKATHVDRVTRTLYSLTEDTYALMRVDGFWIKSATTNRHLIHNSMYKEV